MVMLDGELSGDVIQLDQLESVTILNVKLHLHGRDLIEDPELRRGLVHLWRAEAESAGLDVDHLDSLGTGEEAMPGWALGAVTSGGQEYLVKALPSLARRADHLHPRRVPLTRLGHRSAVAPGASPTCGSVPAAR